MSLPSKVDKENFRLLDLSSDEESEDLQLEIIPSRKKKISRRERSRGAQKVTEPNVGTELQCAFRWALRGTLLLWMLMLTWICASLYDQVTTIRFDVTRVSSSSNGVNDALQLCHTAAKKLRADASELGSRLYKLETDHAELVRKVESATTELATVSDQLSAAPKLADTPRRLAELQRTVADFGSQITSFDESLKSTHKQAQAAGLGVEEVKKLVQELDARSNSTIANVTAAARREEGFTQDIAALNSTLVETLHTIQDIVKPTSTAVPTVTTAAATSLKAVPFTPSTTTTLPPGPAKPSVLGIGQ